MQRRIILKSFGFKYGKPDANYIFDVGFAKNPAREHHWDFFSRPDKKMQQYIEEQEQVQDFVTHAVNLIVFLSSVDAQNVFAFGCSSGRHRSPIITNLIFNKLLERGLSYKDIVVINKADTYGWF